jgi:anthranilate/para-aminobenzoate synthase component II
MKVLMVDNYDSFTYNLVQYLGELGCELEVVRNDPRHRRRAAGARLRSRRRLAGAVHAQRGWHLGRRDAPLPRGRRADLGVCLGHQSLAQAFGGTVIRHLPVHGKTTTIDHDGRTIFAGLPSPLTVGRYHSLVVDENVPSCFEISASGGGVVMAIRHRDLPAEGVQFHPESVLTDEGKRLLANFLD